MAKKLFCGTRVASGTFRIDYGGKKLQTLPVDFD
jgi:hypothetical protein